MNKEHAKEQAAAEYQKTLETLGNLDVEEIQELVRYEILIGTQSVNDQIRRYFLKLKSENPEKAEEMLNLMEPLLEKGVNSVQDVRELCVTLHKFWSGFVVYFNGKSYSLGGGNFKENGGEIL